MKDFGIAALVALGTILMAFNASASQTKIQVATRLHHDCVVARISNMELPTRRAPILNLVEEIDTWCYIWALVWYKAQFNEELEESEAVADRFNKNRIQFRRIVKEQLLSEALR